MNKHKAGLLSALSLILAPAMVMAATDTYTCPVSHFLRVGGSEIRSAAISVRNPDMVHAAIIDRITIRNVFGTVVHDSGPAAGVAHPLNTDFATPLDITTVPPGASYYIRTNHIWGTDGLPVAAGGNEAGQAMSATVQVSKQGRRAPLIVGTRPHARDRVFNGTGFVEGAERSSSTTSCELLI